VSVVNNHLDGYADRQTHPRTVVIGSGTAGLLAANRLRSLCQGAEFHIVVLDRIDPRDPELELLVALGLYGPHALQPPEHQRLRDGIGFRHVEVASVDTGRRELCLTDGTTLAYDALVIATGLHPLPPGLADGHRFLPVDPRTFQSTTTPEVFALGPAAGPASSADPRACVQAETLARSVRRLLTEEAVSTGADSEAEGFALPGP
jgi:NADPH-dependent 2,4-dienoyl-CoA reductase/sulfur reductase-like enzyme